jgi:hypothetical protein
MRNVIFGVVHCAVVESRSHSMLEELREHLKFCCDVNRRSYVCLA